MTDKQIIIDGVDVSGCKYWKGYCRIASLCDYAGHLCEVNPSCDYKQFKRKEQECENNKIAHQIELDIYNQECLNLQEELKETLEQLYQLKAENDELKRELMQYDKDVKDLNYFAMKLKQTLTEIKEIAEKIDDSDGCVYGDYDCDNCSSLEQETVCTYKVKKLILQKTSEVEDDRL